MPKDILTEYGTASFKGTVSPSLSPDDKVVVLNGDMSGEVGIVVSVSGNAYRSDNRVVVHFANGVSWFHPWDLRPVQ